MREGILLLAAVFLMSAAEPGGPRAAGSQEAPSALSGLPSPSPDIAPGDVVRIQLDALRANDESNQGIAVAFRFASPQNKASTGPLPRFIQMIKTGPYRLMLEFEHARYAPIKVEGARAAQGVVLVGRREIRRYVFLLQRQSGPICKGCWMTEAVMVVPGMEQEV